MNLFSFKRSNSSMAKSIAMLKTDVIKRFKNIRLLRIELKQRLVRSINHWFRLLRR